MNDKIRKAAEEIYPMAAHYFSIDCCQGDYVGCDSDQLCALCKKGWQEKVTGIVGIIENLINPLNINDYELSRKILEEINDAKKHHDNVGYSVVRISRTLEKYRPIGEREVGGD